MGYMKGVYKMLVGKLEWKKTFGRPRHRWEENTTMDVSEIGWEYVNGIHLVHDRDSWGALMKALINFGFHKRRRIS
jgi:hypothetical protein